MEVKPKLEGMEVEMKTLVKALRVSAMTAMMAASALVAAQPQVVDSQGRSVGVAGGIGPHGVPFAYYSVDGSLTILEFTTIQNSALLTWWPNGPLYYTTTDCSGAVYIAPDTSLGGTLPYALLLGKNHIWLHLADSMDSIGQRGLRSQSNDEGICTAVNRKTVVWKSSKPAIDLATQFTPPFSIR
jgi:hypothetical protein